MASKGIHALRAAITDATKFSKASVKYEHPAAKSDHCGICGHFAPPYTCEVVRGHILPEDWCERFLVMERHNG